jgi:hypothetical protein
MKATAMLDLRDHSRRSKSLKSLERVKGIEPSYSAWKGFVG